MLDALVVAPHPDDAELGLGGTIVRLIGQGWRVGILDLTSGEPTPLGSPERRAEETAAANRPLPLFLQRPPPDRRPPEPRARRPRAARSQGRGPALLSIATGRQPARGQARRDRLGLRPPPLLGPPRGRPARRALRQPRAGRT